MNTILGDSGEMISACFCGGPASASSGIMTGFIGPQRLEDVCEVVPMAGGSRFPVGA